MSGNRSLPIASGDVIDGRFRVERVLGSGGMGTVVCALHLQLREHVAIKFLHAQSAKDDEARARFLREARLSARLRNQHVTRLMDFGVCEDGTPILVMEFLAGVDLGQRLRTDGPLAVEDTVEYLLHASEALAEAHGQGLIHRDVKPSNLFLTQAPDGTPMVKVLDFGISKVVTEDGDDSSLAGPITDKFALIGSPGYMSPEHVCGHTLDVRADIWSLGVLLYEMLTGTAPFERDSVAETFAAVLNQDPEPLRSVRADAPQALEKLAQWCLAKDLSKRCPDVADFAEALVAVAPRDTRRVQCDRIRRLVRTTAPDATPLAALDLERQGGTSVTAWKRTRHVTQRRRGVAVFASALVLVSVAAAAGFVSSTLRSAAGPANQTLLAAGAPNSTSTDATVGVAAASGPGTMPAAVSVAEGGAAAASASVSAWPQTDASSVPTAQRPAAVASATSRVGRSSQPSAATPIAAHTAKPVATASSRVASSATTAPEPTPTTQEPTSLSLSAPSASTKKLGQIDLDNPFRSP